MVTMTWITTLFLGVGAMFLMQFTPNWGDAILIRVAALLVAGAGAMGATGWVGRAFTTLLGWLTDLINAISKDLLGTPVMWVLALFAGVMWVGALLPHKLFKLNYSDGLVLFGFPLPSLLLSVPGKAGDSLRTVVLEGSHWVVQWVGGLFS
jgi:hypothetical protein